MYQAFVNKRFGTTNFMTYL